MQVLLQQTSSVVNFYEDPDNKCSRLPKPLGSSFESHMAEEKQ